MSQSSPLYINSVYLKITNIKFIYALSIHREIQMRMQFYTNEISFLVFRVSFTTRFHGMYCLYKGCSGLFIGQFQAQMKASGSYSISSA